MRGHGPQVGVDARRGGPQLGEHVAAEAVEGGPGGLGGAVERADDGAAAVGDRHGDRPQALLELLVDDGVAGRAGLVDEPAEDVAVGDGPAGQRDEVDPVEVGVELVGAEPGEEHAAEGGGVGREAVPTAMVTVMIRRVGTRTT